MTQSEFNHLLASLGGAALAESVPCVENKRNGMNSVLQRFQQPGLFVPSLASILLAGSPAFIAYVSLVGGPVCRKAGTAAQGRDHQPLSAPLPQPAKRSLAVGGSR